MDTVIRAVVSEAIFCLGEDRQALGRCMANLQLAAERACKAGGRQQSWEYDFARAPDKAQPGSPEECCVSEGELVIMSVEGELLRLTKACSDGVWAPFWLFPFPHKNARMMTVCRFQSRVIRRYVDQERRDLHASACPVWLAVSIGAVCAM
jgi:hypothetical protein